MAATTREFIGKIAVPNDIHFGCTGLMPHVVTKDVKIDMIKALAMIEDSFHLDYQRIGKTDFCETVTEILNGARKVIAIDALCAINNKMECSGQCGVKLGHHFDLEPISSATPSKYNARYLYVFNPPKPIVVDGTSHREAVHPRRTQSMPILPSQAVNKRGSSAVSPVATNAWSYLSSGLARVTDGLQNVLSYLADPPPQQFGSAEDDSTEQ